MVMTLERDRSDWAFEPLAERFRAPAASARHGWLQRLARWSTFSTHLEPRSPLLRQLPFTLLFVAAVILAWATPIVPLTNGPFILGGLAVVALGTMLAGGLALGRIAPHTAWAGFVPTLDFIAVEMLRYGSGGNRSVFAVLVIIPAIWLASNPARWYVAWAVAGVAFVYLLPFDSAPVKTATSTLHGIFTVLAFIGAATLTNELARLARTRLQVVQEHDRTIYGELTRGGDLQQALLPADGSPIAGYDVAGTCIPARVVGGDFYDWYAIPGGIGFTLGDVMGKGVVAGMIAATTRAVVRSARAVPDPAVAVRRADVSLSTDLAEAGAFATVFHARLRASDGRVLYSDAGHGLTLHVHVDHSWERIVSADLPVGLDLGGDWSMRELRLAEGEMLVSFSDGVLDLYKDSPTAIDAMGDIASSAESPLEVIDALRQVAVGPANPDDVTAIAIRRGVHAA